MNYSDPQREGEERQDKFAEMSRRASAWDVSDGLLVCTLSFDLNSPASSYLLDRMLRYTNDVEMFSSLTNADVSTLKMLRKRFGGSVSQDNGGAAFNNRQGNIEED